MFVCHMQDFWPAKRDLVYEVLAADKIKRHPSYRADVEIDFRSILQAGSIYEWIHTDL